jgi:hypothetical protein
MSGKFKELAILWCCPFKVEGQRRQILNLSFVLFGRWYLKFFFFLISDYDKLISQPWIIRGLTQAFQNQEQGLIDSNNNTDKKNKVVKIFANFRKNLK